jgi:predicted amidophosphoribosyltransferase
VGQDRADLSFMLEDQMLKMTDVQCIRCPNKLAVSNKNPYRICAECSKELNSHQPGSKALQEWIEAGHPREINFRVKSPTRQPKDLSKLSTQFLILCARELTRREKEAKATIDALARLKR